MPSTKTKKEEKSTPEHFEQAVAQALNSYFTPEINARISELDDDQMFTLLRDLERSEYWYAILRYTNKRALIAQSAINSYDPVANPTAIARTQGAMTGLSDLQNAVITLKVSEESARKDSQEIIDAL